MYFLLKMEDIPARYVIVYQRVPEGSENIPQVSWEAGTSLGVFLP